MTASTSDIVAILVLLLVIVLGLVYAGYELAGLLLG